MKIEKRLLLLSCMIFCLAVAPAGADCPVASCIFVDDDCAAPPGTGSELDPFCTIQDAYDASAMPGELITILVMPGEYHECVFAGDIDAPPIQPSGGLSADYLDKPVELIADAWIEADMPDPLDPDFEDVAKLTTITGFGVCDGLGNDRAATVNIAGTEAKLQGFAITQGGASGVNAIGGVDVDHNLVFVNEGELGGGIALRTETCFLSEDAAGPITIEANVTSNVVRNNIADNLSETGNGDGGGIYVLADGFEEDHSGCVFVAGGQSNVKIADNLVMQNIAQNLVKGTAGTFASGGGLAVETVAVGAHVFPLVEWQARVRVTGNTFSGNTVVTTAGIASGAGISSVSAGTGLETVVIENNTVGPDNVGSSALSSSFGGGISAATETVIRALHEITIDGNTIFDNTADVGGGLDLLILPRDLNPSQRVVVTASNNTIENNLARFEAGGLHVEFNSERSLDTDDAGLFPPGPLVAEELTVAINNNTLKGNRSQQIGAGAVLKPDANSDPDSDGSCAGNESPATALIDFFGNFVEGNVSEGSVLVGTGGIGCSDPVCEAAVCAIDPFCCNVEWDLVCTDEAQNDVGTSCNCSSSNCCGSFLVGSGVLVRANARGESVAGASINNSTIVGNTIATGSVGGTEIFGVTTPDCPGKKVGATTLTIDRSIIADNGGFGVGGPIPDPNNLTTFVTNSFVFDNGAGEYQPTLFSGVPPGNSTEDPRLDSATFVPDVCSPAYDVFGFCENDPAQDCLVDGECVASGGDCLLAGAGFLASPDINHDDAVDGVDLLRFSTGFGAEDGVQLRYLRGADLDRNGTIDGIDLMFIAPLFAQECVE